MARSTFRFEAPVWEHDGPAPWCFVSLPEAVADEIEERFGQRAGGFGSVRVEVTVGATTWRTSLFPDRARATYLLPVKRAVRVAAHLCVGDVARVHLRVLA